MLVETWIKSRKIEFNIYEGSKKNYVCPIFSFRGEKFGHHFKRKQERFCRKCKKKLQKSNIVLPTIIALKEVLAGKIIYLSREEWIGLLNETGAALEKYDSQSAKKLLDWKFPDYSKLLIQKALRYNFAICKAIKFLRKNLLPTHYGHPVKLIHLASISGHSLSIMTFAYEWYRPEWQENVFDWVNQVVRQGIKLEDIKDYSFIDLDIARSPCVVDFVKKIMESNQLRNVSTDLLEMFLLATQKRLEELCREKDGYLYEEVGKGKFCID